MDLCMSRLVESSLIQYLRWRPMPLWMALAQLSHVTQRWLLGAPPLGAIQQSKSQLGQEFQHADMTMIRRQAAGTPSLRESAATQPGPRRQRGPEMPISVANLDSKSRVVGALTTFRLVEALVRGRGNHVCILPGAHCRRALSTTPGVLCRITG